jgi:hypothetical protein
MVTDNPDYYEPRTANDVGGPGDTLRPAEATDSDDVRNDDGDQVVEPPEGWQGADKFGVTTPEASEGESLDDKLEAEEPDTVAAEQGGWQEPDVEDVDGTGVHRGQVDDTPEDGESLFPVVDE